jgi:hypothetical protein
MAHADDTRASTLQAFERDAELLVVHQLDLVAQIEAQLRAVHHAMRRIEQLRGTRLRVGAELSNRERQTMLTGLSTEVAELDKHLSEEHQCCRLMQDTIAQMQERLAALKQTATRLDRLRDADSAS